MNMHAITIFVLPAILLLYWILYKSVGKRTPSLGVKITNKRFKNGRGDIPCSFEGRQRTVPSPELILYKELYYKLQNLEEFPDVLPTARQTLFRLLDEALEIERCASRPRSILALGHYDPEALENFVLGECDNVASEWEAYGARRARGGLRELFPDRDAAIPWLKRHAPLKFVDGAWLGHINKISTPLRFRELTKGLWQILSEELGDGCLERNHVYLYEQLLRSVGVLLPQGSSREFTHTQHGLDDLDVWRAAVAQLLISIFPNELLPEILGFNLHYELITSQTLKASKELPELGISGLYFSIHVSIDNADSGHTGMAIESILKYFQILHSTEPSMVDNTWKRIQAGYILSKNAGEKRRLSPLDHRVVNLLRQKADVSHSIHCMSRVRILGLSLAEWLSPATWKDTEECKSKFLDALASAKPWIVAGSVEKSRLIHEIYWNGRMFGAFTNLEVADLQKWIEGLAEHDLDYETLYWSVFQQDRRMVIAQQLDEGMSDAMVLRPMVLKNPTSPDPSALFEEMQYSNLKISQAPAEDVICLWLTHPCILENMVCSPYRTATSIGSSIVSILRAEMGFLEVGACVAGRDEQTTPCPSISLVSLGLEMAERAQIAPVGEISDIVGTKAKASPQVATLCRELLCLSKRPVQYRCTLLGLAFAFLDLEAAVAADTKFLSMSSRRALQLILERKRKVVDVCLRQFRTSNVDLNAVICSFRNGRQRIETLLCSQGSR